MSALKGAMHDNQHDAVVIGEPPLFDVFFTEAGIKDYRGVLKSDSKKAAAFNALLRARNIFKGDSKFYVSLAHDEDDVEQTIQAIRSAASALKDIQ